jgi:ABC-type transport system substrate-binding protein
MLVNRRQRQPCSVSRTVRILRFRGRRYSIRSLCWLVALWAIAAGRSPAAEPLILREDDATKRVTPGLVKGSHVKVFIPSLPYLYTSHSINAGLIRPSDNAQGWEFDMATAYRQIDEKTHEFELREGVQFQDGSPFNADAVVLNMEHFKRKPTLYSKIHLVFDRAEKIDDRTVRFHLTEKYGSFLNDAIWMHFYTAAYLEKFGWNGKSTCPNLAEPGPYGLGPFILKEGYVEGDRHTPEVVLEANPHYWDKRYPKVEKITIHTKLDSAKARDMVLNKEGELDLTTLSPEDKVAAILAPHSKLLTSSSTNNITIHINMRNGNPRLLEKDVRLALNQALHQANLLHFVYEGEGEVASIGASPNFPGVREVSHALKPYSEIEDPYAPGVQMRLRKILEGLHLRVFTQDRFLPLWRGIESQLGKVGVTLAIEVAPSEAEIFGTLLTTNARENKTQWDLLVWGNDDWYFNHPFTVFFVFRTHDVWSTVFPDPVMDGYIEEMFRTAVAEPEFVPICEKIMRRAHENAYLLAVPAPNNVFALNKEIVIRPYQMACMPLWKIQVTDQHWSVRQGAYPEHLKQPVEVTRIIR